MSNNKLITYLQFLFKMKEINVGEKLIYNLKKKKIKYLIILPNCPIKIEDNLTSICQSDVTIYKYDGKTNLSLILGYEKLNAFGTNSKLGEKIIEELTKEVQDVKEK